MEGLVRTGASQIWRQTQILAWAQIWRHGTWRTTAHTREGFYLAKTKGPGWRNIANTIKNKYKCKVNHWYHHICLELRHKSWFYKYKSSVRSNKIQFLDTPAYFGFETRSRQRNGSTCAQLVLTDVLTYLSSLANTTLGEQLCRQSRDDMTFRSDIKKNSLIVM